MKIIAAMWHESDEKKLADAHRAEQETLRAAAKKHKKSEGDVTTAGVVGAIGQVVEVKHDAVNEVST
jgi:hypothetical protein